MAPYLNVNDLEGVDGRRLFDTPKDFARSLGVSIPTVYRWLDAGLPHITKIVNNQKWNFIPRVVGHAWVRSWGESLRLRTGPGRPPKSLF